MPKRIGFVYDRMLNHDSCVRYIKSAARNKKKRRAVRKALENIDAYATELETMLREGTFRPTPPNRRKIYDATCGKWRMISSVPFWPDGCIHAAVSLEIEPIIMRSMDAHVCASIPKRGAKHARRYLRRAIRSDVKGTKYAAELDVRKCYPSTSIPSVMAALRQRIKDERFLVLVEDILRAGHDGDVGLEIGYRVSQWLMNYYLEPVDRAIRRMPGVKHYIRYMDNFTLMGPNKKKLRRARIAIELELEKLGLQLKGDWQVFPIKDRPVRAVGYRFHRDGAITLKKTTALRFMRQARKAKKQLKGCGRITPRLARSLLSRCGRAQHCTIRGLLKKYILGIIKKLKEAARFESIRMRKSSGLHHRGHPQEAGQSARQVPRKRGGSREGRR